MSSNYPYIKTLVIFPLLAQLIGTIVSICVDGNTDGLLSTTDLVLFSLLSTFIVATVPAFLIALWTKIYRYTRYNMVAIVLISLIIAFCYGNVASFIYMTLSQPNMTFGIWLRSGGIDMAFLLSFGMALYSVLVLPLLLPQTR
ncbi:hypothetical protein SC1083_0009 [Aggregatibacter actinomycetemcomitans serotype e str. SC1083]|uniref:Uncharacterized protein n=1 Tax=Aggregatibacter actinomycetemcomitans serotype e str. SC1083 TaxID=907488 RepID=G4A5C4_AGGAC|nr:hypothetical protein [Aggregatibacter actinomycetemcomitans]EGY35314.1 hypothetical protein SC1083_0009 [Aggregatibacter actinomycetemcomitans serotype e str. SC1083]KYK75506.1 hypothetical protein SA3096_02950 [Aggregatibacter actinomycetemcomitans serotype e str. SA3096]KYK79280.1 hypothetical protein SC936_07875 [Aggregatibacter actinomycetemcomitans serotype e str. SC936]KYK94813.1 hypothetical protein ANH9776_06270 [Aggregatibacter actinomycetemcomitans serotype e str. ANH9776]TYB21077